MHNTYIVCKKENMLYRREPKFLPIEEYKFTPMGYLDMEQGILEKYVKEKDSLTWCKRCEEVTKKKCYLE